MAMWAAILITLVASTACSVGKALQKEATRHLPRFSMETRILQQYFHSRVWLSGLAADLGGGVLQIAAFALAPVRRGPLPALLGRPPRVVRRWGGARGTGQAARPRRPAPRARRYRWCSPCRAWGWWAWRCTATSG